MIQVFRNFRTGFHAIVYSKFLVRVLEFEVLPRRPFGSGWRLSSITKSFGTGFGQKNGG